MRSNRPGKSRAEKIWDLKVEIFSVLFGIVVTYFFFGSGKDGGSAPTTVINHWHIGNGVMNFLWGGIALIGIAVIGRIIHVLSRASDAIDALDDASDITDLFDLF